MAAGVAAPSRRGGLAVVAPPVLGAAVAPIWVAAMLRTAMLAAAVLAAGCGPSLATMQPAQVAPKGHFQATAALEIGIPTGTIVGSIDAGRALSQVAAQGTLTSDQERKVFEAGVNVLASPPSAGPHLALAYSPVERIEVGLRYAGGGWRAGARYQALRHEEAPFDLTVGAGLSRSTYGLPLSDVIPILQVPTFTRSSLDVSVLVGTSRSWFRVWTGPKFLWSRFDTALRLSIPSGNVESASFEGRATYAGGQAGVALGYQHLFFGVEVTVAEAVGSATVSATSLSSVRPVDFSGLVIYPAFGLMGEL